MPSFLPADWVLVFVGKKGEESSPNTHFVRLIRRLLQGTTYVVSAQDCRLCDQIMMLSINIAARSGTGNLMVLITAGAGVVTLLYSTARIASRLRVKKIERMIEYKLSRELSRETSSADNGPCCATGLIPLWDAQSSWSEAYMHDYSPVSSFLTFLSFPPRGRARRELARRPEARACAVAGSREPRAKTVAPAKFCRGGAETDFFLVTLAAPAFLTFLPGWHLPVKG